MENSFNLSLIIIKKLCARFQLDEKHKGIIGFCTPIQSAFIKKK